MYVQYVYILMKVNMNVNMYFIPLNKHVGVYILVVKMSMAESPLC